MKKTLKGPSMNLGQPVRLREPWPLVTSSVQRPRGAFTQPKATPPVQLKCPPVNVPGSRPQPAATALQTRAANSAPAPFNNNSGRLSVVQRVHPSPQTKTSPGQLGAVVPAAERSRIVTNAAAARTGYRPQTVPRVLQSKPLACQHATNKDSRRILHPSGTRLESQRTTVQRFTSRIVQATKYYPNLHPGAVEPVDHGNIFKLNSFANQYRLHKVNSHGVNVPNQQYNFVRTTEGEMLLHSRYRHPSIAEGKQVLYAGEIFFNNGQLQWWSNGSGHYQPYVEDAEQANLPMDHFFSYQQILKGEHTRKKGQLQ